MPKPTGRPRFVLSDQTLLDNLTAGLNIPAIAVMHGCSADTIRRRITAARKVHGAGWGKRPPRSPAETAQYKNPPPDESDLPDWSDVDAVKAWRLKRWASLASRDGSAAIAAIDKISAATIDNSTAESSGGMSRVDATKLRAMQRRLSLWIGQAIQRRLDRHEQTPSDDEAERDRDERLLQAWKPVARLEATDEQRETLRDVLAEYGDPCSI